jgi:hypothetical protein
MVKRKLVNVSMTDHASGCKGERGDLMGKDDRIFSVFIGKYAAGFIYHKNIAYMDLCALFSDLADRIERELGSNGVIAIETKQEFTDRIDKTLFEALNG